MRCQRSGQRPRQSVAPQRTRQFGRHLHLQPYRSATRADSINMLQANSEKVMTWPHACTSISVRIKKTVRVHWWWWGWWVGGVKVVVWQERWRGGRLNQWQRSGALTSLLPRCNSLWLTFLNYISHIVLTCLRGRSARLNEIFWRCKNVFLTDLWFRF